MRTTLCLSMLGLLLGACVTPQEDKFLLLRAGQWVEAKGEVVEGEPIVQEIEELDRAEYDTADKYEISYRADTGLEENSFTVLDQKLYVDEETEYEDEDKNLLDPFPVRAGDWMKVKVRIKDEGLRARTIRRMEERDFFKVEGEVAAVDMQERRLQVGSVEMRMSRDADLDLLNIRNPNDPLSLFLADEQKSVPFSVELAENLRLGGQYFSRTEFERDFDLDSDRKRDRWKLLNEAKLDVLWLMGNGGYALVEGKIGRSDRLNENRPNTTDDSAVVSRAFASVPLHDNLQLLVGRQDFDEEREWLYDEVLDGVRLMGRLGQFQGEISASVGREVLEEDNDTEDTTTFTALARYWVDREHRFTAYAIRRTDSSVSDFEPLLIGLRSYARPSRGLGHWVELAHASGNAGPRDIDGYAVDVGLLYRFDTPIRPTVYAGYAFGSGRRATSTEEGFRQTGLQDNNAKFGGVTSFRYYGEVLEPELSNLGITTIGFGFRPVRDMSVDLAFHTYRQDVASSVLAENELRPTPTGLSRDLGWAADFVFGYRFRDRAHIEVLAGHFEPGDAFLEQDAAQKVQLQLRLSF